MPRIRLITNHQAAWLMAAAEMRRELSRESLGEYFGLDANTVTNYCTERHKGSTKDRLMTKALAEKMFESMRQHVFGLLRAAHETHEPGDGV